MAHPVELLQSVFLFLVAVHYHADRPLSYECNSWGFNRYFKYSKVGIMSSNFSTYKYIWKNTTLMILSRLYIYLHFCYDSHLEVEALTFKFNPIIFWNLSNKIRQHNCMVPKSVLHSKFYIIHWWQGVVL